MPPAAFLRAASSSRADAIVDSVSPSCINTEESKAISSVVRPSARAAPAAVIEKASLSPFPHTKPAPCHISCDTVYDGGRGGDYL
ncbi:MAG: hypothetical protein FWH02_09040 [Oscillospiraceae bacterium]|nr:hypothetical protein [Oscillospiraceae bacterium]